MSIPTFNKFKSTTIYGAFNNLDYEDNTVQASSNIQRNLTVGGDLSCNGIINGNKLYYNGVDISSNFLQKDISGNVSISGIINGNKLYYNNVDISSTFVSNTSLTTTLNSYALSSGTTFTGNVSGLTAITSDNSNKFATTAFVKAQNYISSNPDLSQYALLSGAFFTGTVSGLTAVSTDNSNKLATTAFVKSQGYINNGALSPYALLGGATFTGNVAGLTAVSTDNSTKFATTAFVKAQNYITSSALSPYALSSALSNYALSSSLSNYALSSTLNDHALLTGATFTGNVNGLTAFSTDNTTKFATTAFVKAQNYITSTALSSYALLSGTTFSGTVNGITPATADNSTKIATTAWVKLQNYLTANTPTYSTITVPTTNTLDNFQGNYWTQYSVRPTNSVTTLNGITTVNIGLPLGSTPNTSSIIISNTFYALGTVANPDTALNDTYCLLSPSYGATPTNTTNFFNINMYNANTGARIRGYGTLLKSFSTNSYGITFIATDGVGFAVNTPYYYDPFQFTYN